MSFFEFFWTCQVARGSTWWMGGAWADFFFFGVVFGEYS